MTQASTSLFQRLQYYSCLLFVLAWSGLVFIGGAPIYLLGWKRRSLNRLFGKILSYPILKVLGIRIKVAGSGYLEAPQPCVYVANHQSAIEVIIFGHLMPRRTLIIGKKEIRWVPFFGLFFEAAGNILIDRRKSRKASSVLKQAVDTMKDTHSSILIFPEGTRNPGGGHLLPFKKGPFHLAIAAQLPIVPIVIDPIENFWNARKHQVRRGVLHVRVLPPMDTAGRSDQDVQALAEQVRAAMLASLSG